MYNGPRALRFSKVSIAQTKLESLLASSCAGPPSPAGHRSNSARSVADLVPEKHVDAVYWSPSVRLPARVVRTAATRVRGRGGGRGRRGGRGVAVAVVWRLTGVEEQDAVGGLVHDEDLVASYLAVMDARRRLGRRRVLPVRETPSAAAAAAAAGGAVVVGDAVTAGELPTIIGGDQSAGGRNG